VLRPWFKRLYRFSPNLQLQFDRLLKIAKPSPDSKLFCAQVRIGGKPVDGNNKYDDFEFMKVDRAAEYWKFIEGNFIKNSTNYKIFLTTDNIEVIKMGREHFGSDRLVTSTNNAFHFDYQLLDKKCEEATGLFVDFSMLSECEMGVVSHSGYGMVPILKKVPETWKNFFVYSSKYLLYEAVKTGSFWKKRTDYNLWDYLQIFFEAVKTGSFWNKSDQNHTMEFLPFNKDFFYVVNDF